MSATYRVLPILCLFVCTARLDPRPVVLLPAQELHLETHGIASGSFLENGFLSGGMDGAVLRHNARGAPQGNPQPLAKFPIDAVIQLPDGSILASSGGRLIHQSRGKIEASDAWSSGSYVRLAATACADRGDGCFVAGDDRGLLVFGSTKPLRKLHTVRAANGGLRGLAVLPGGQVATTSDDGLVTLTPPRGSKARRVKHRLGAPGAGLALFVGAKGGQTGQPLLAVGTTTGQVVLLSIRMGEPTPQLGKLAETQVASDAITALAFSQEGNELLAGNARGHVVRLNIEAGALKDSSRPTVDFEGHLERVLTMRALPTGWQTAAADGLVRTWDKSGRPIDPAYLGHRDAVNVVRFLTNDVLLSGGGSESYETGIRRWSRGGGPLTPALTLGREDVTAVVRTDTTSGAFAVGTRDSRLHLFDAPLASPKRVQLPGTPIALAYSKSKGFIIGDDRGHLIFTDRDARVEKHVKAHGLRIAALALSPDQKRILTGGWDHVVQLFDANGQSLWKRKDHKLPVSAVAWTRDGRRIISGGWDNSIHIRRAETGVIEKSCVGHTDWVRDFSVHPTKDLFASVGDDRRLFLWDFACRKLAERRLHQDVIASVDFAPDGELIATGGRDRRVYVLKVADLLR